MKLIKIIDDIFNEEELNNILQKFKLMNFEKSIFEGDDNMRNSIQCNTIHYDVAKIILNKTNIYDIIEINPMMRYIKYINNGYFKLHYDENYEYNNLISKYTIIIYLNDCLGETIITDDDFNKHIIKNIKNRMVIFDQDLEHEATNRTNKYIIRTDAMILKV